MKWKSDSIKSSGYTGNFEERKLDIKEQFGFVEISIFKVQAEIYIFSYGILIALLVLVIEFCLIKHPQLMLYTHILDNRWTYVQIHQAQIEQKKLVCIAPCKDRLKSRTHKINIINEKQQNQYSNRRNQSRQRARLSQTLLSLRLCQFRNAREITLREFRGIPDFSGK